MTKIAKKILIGISILIAIPVVFFAAIAAILLVVTLMVYIDSPLPDVPVIREGEFPFRIVYEDNGALIEIEDAYVCKYNGIDVDIISGTSLDWDINIKSGNEKALTVFEDATTEVGISVGGVWYYMGDPHHPKENGGMTPSAYRITRENGGILTEPLSDEELYSEYGIKIISWELPEPIENTFVPKKWYEFWK